MLAPRDFGAVTSGAATLLYRVEWRPVPVQPRDSDDSIPRRRTPPPVSTAPWRVACVEIKFRTPHAIDATSSP